MGQCTGSPQGCNRWRPTACARWLTGDPTTHHLLGVSPQFFFQCVGPPGLPDRWKAADPEAVREYRKRERRDKADTAVMQAARRRIRAELRQGE